MKILIAGGTGFIGSALVKRLRENHLVTILSRSVSTDDNTLNWQDLSSLNGYDVVVNLVGENIGDKRWTRERKQRIMSSRIETTSRLAHLCASADEPKPRLLNASAIGIYGLQDEKCNELPIAFDDHSVIDCTSAPDFLSEVAVAWEQATAPAVEAGCAVTWLRFGVVLDQAGGALKKLLPSFKMGLGAVIGSGHQPFTWISLEDATRAIEFIIQQKMNGPVCIVAPEAVTQREFARLLARALQRPCFLKLPHCLIHALFGEMGDALLLKGQHVKPTRLQASGFNFYAPTLWEALKEKFQNRV